MLKQRGGIKRVRRLKHKAENDFRPPRLKITLPILKTAKLHARIKSESGADFLRENVWEEGRF